MKSIKNFLILTLFAVLLTMPKSQDASVDMNNYCYKPPSIAQEIPPIVMFVMGRDHKLYYEAYNDASDLDDDGKIDVGYKHSIDYYGYFDPYKCYDYDGSKFVPVSKTTNKYCSGQWSGNFLNWLSMSRMDVLRKVLYGGHRSTDSANETVLEGVYIPQDAHSWGKEYSGNDTSKLTPYSVPLSGTRHLFCITSTSEGEPHKIRVLLNKSNRIWEWASKEGPVCDNSLGIPNYEYYVRVKVCDSNVGLESNCKKYPQGTYKPIGLLQKYGEGEVDKNGQPQKWCSKTLKYCNTDSDCDPSTTHGLCIEKGRMYFGLLTGSYTKNLSGGVLRKNIWSIMDEINSQTGIFQSSENTQGNIILTLDRMKVIGFRYSDYTYQDSSGGTCGWITDHPLNEGECRMWGNPVAEMMYESLRYLAGKGSPTTSFTYSGNQDSTLNLSKPKWGIKRGNTTYQPYQLFPYCAKPFMIVLSDINNSYDSDSLPGSNFGGISGDLVGLNVSNLANIISNSEGIAGKYFIGQSGSSLYDFICSPKNITGFSNIRGLCPEEPTKQGSYYAASVAYYGNTQFKNNLGSNYSNVKTYVVALASPIPDLAFKIGGGTVRIKPLGKSVSGCLNVYNNCAQKCTLTKDSNGNLRITNCQSNAFCPTNQIVDYYIEQINYDSNGNLTYAKLRINYEDVEQGADHDMDAIVLYEIQPIGTGQIKIKVTSEYASGCIDQVLGFTISGTTEDGPWLVVKDKDVSGGASTPSVVANMPLSWERTFTVTGGAAGQLKEPLWYAAKWGGFDDINGNNIPDLQSEWDKDGDGVPDTYFKVVNPLKMEQQLEKALSDILRRASSGSTVATLASRAGISSLIVQPYFYPKYLREDGTELTWLGFLRSFWIDLQQNLREDTVMNKILDMAQNTWDKIIQFITVQDETKVAVLKGDTYSGSNACQLDSVKDLNQVMPVFDSGCWLANANPPNRTIKYNKEGSLTVFTTSEADYLAGIWQNIDSTINQTKAGCIIRYLRGEDLSADATCSSLDYVKRPRELNINSFCGVNQIKTWKLGDIIHSTPSVVSDQSVNSYHLRYGDSSYSDFIRQDNYKNRPTIAFVGANDGMLHAFRVGTVINQANPEQPSKLQNAPNDTGTNKIGQEEWAFIPKNAVPYLIWYGHKDYCHVPTVDYRTLVVDAKIGRTWKTLLVGAMGFGGKALAGFSSSVFVLDITDPLNPKLLWEKTLPDQTLTLSFPAVVVQNSGSDWYVVIGSGPLNPNGTQFTTAKLYFFKLSDGGLVNTLTLKEGNNDVTAAVGDIMPVDVDNDYSDDAIYFGTYTLNSGNFYRISLKSGNSYKSISSLSDSDITKAVSISRPIFAAPNFTKDEFGRLWVFFGTGRYLDSSDKTISYTNYLVGFKDPCWNGSCTTTYSLGSFTNTTSTQVQATVTETKKICSCSGSSCGLVDVVYDTTPVTSIQEATTGWYLTLNGEAIISQPAIFGGVLDELSLVPPQDICAYEGSSNLYALYYKSGTAYPRPVVLSSLATSGTQSTVTVYAKISLGRGIPPLGNPFQITQGISSREYTKFIQVSAGAVLRVKQQIAGYEGRFISWIEK